MTTDQLNKAQAPVIERTEPPTPEPVEPRSERIDWLFIGHNIELEPASPRANPPAVWMFVRDPAEALAAIAALSARDKARALYPLIFVAPGAQEALLDAWLRAEGIDPEARYAEDDEREDARYDRRGQLRTRLRPFGDATLGWEVLLTDADCIGGVPFKRLDGSGLRTEAEYQKAAGRLPTMVATVLKTYVELKRAHGHAPSMEKLAIAVRKKGIEEPEAAPAPAPAAPEPRTKAKHHGKAPDYQKRIRALVKRFRKEHNRGPSQEEIADGVTGRRAAILATVKEMAAEGELHQIHGKPDLYVIGDE